MKNKDPVFWAARRLHRVLSQASEQVDDLAFRAAAVTAEHRAMERLRTMLGVAESRGWGRAAAALRERLLAHAARVQSGCEELRQERRRPSCPSLPELLCELRQLHDEFERVEVQARHGRVYAATDAITLEDVPLGKFSIQLCLGRLAAHRDASAFEVVAEDPNPASGSDDSAHPHVSGCSLCAGEATVPIAAALAEGRICDAFCLVSAVLHTYNPASAYVSLSDWEGVTCGDCGRSSHADETYYCEGCGRDYCDSCISNCERCDRSLCLSCLEEDEGGDRVCIRCRRKCRNCGGGGDAARLGRQHGLCDDCRAEEEGEEDAQDTEGQDTDEGVLVGSTEHPRTTEQPDGSQLDHHEQQSTEPGGVGPARADASRREAEVGANFATPYGAPGG